LRTALRTDAAVVTEAAEAAAAGTTNEQFFTVCPS
jgi:hypothetical protein